MEIKENKILHNLADSKSLNFYFFILIFLALVGLGIGVGYLAGNAIKTQNSTATNQAIVGSKKSEGVLDKKKFPDAAEGLLKEGGVEGEGSFHLERPGGESQNVYLTSSIVDLSKYVGKKIRVWGETQKAQKAGWLMDVGYTETL